MLGIGQENKDAHEADSPYPEQAPKFATHAVAVSANAISDAAGDAHGAPEWIMVIRPASSPVAMGVARSS
jgi:hypothetical protein